MPQDKPGRVAKRISLAAKLAVRNPTMQEGGLLTNCYEEPTPSKGDRIVKRPGYEQQAVVGSACSGQGAINWMGKILIIGCDTLWDVKYQFMKAVVGQGQLGGSAPINDPVTGAPINGSGGSGGMSVTKINGGGSRILFGTYGGGDIRAVSSSLASSTVRAGVAPAIFNNVASGPTTYMVSTTYVDASFDYHPTMSIYDKSWSLIGSTSFPVNDAFTLYDYLPGVGYFTNYVVDGDPTNKSYDQVLNETGAVVVSSPRPYGSPPPLDILNASCDSTAIWTTEGSPGAKKLRAYDSSLVNTFSKTISTDVQSIGSSGTYQYICAYGGSDFGGDPGLTYVIRLTGGVTSAIVQLPELGRSVSICSDQVIVLGSGTAYALPPDLSSYTSVAIDPDNSQGSLDRYS